MSFSRFIILSMKEMVNSVIKKKERSNRFPKKRNKLCQQNQLQPLPRSYLFEVRSYKPQSHLLVIREDNIYAIFFYTNFKNSSWYEYTGRTNVNNIIQRPLRGDTFEVVKPSFNMLPWPPQSVCVHITFTARPYATSLLLILSVCTPY